MTDTAWQAVLPARTAARVLEAVSVLVGRPRVAPSCVQPDLAGGGAGLVLTYHQLDRCLPGQGWGPMADDYLAATAAGAERLRVTAPGLYGGIGGPAFAALATGRGPAPALWEANILRGTDALRDTLRGAHGVSTRTFDLISGLTGTGAYLLTRAEADQDHDALREILRALVGLCRERAGTPRWHTPADSIRDHAARDRLPHGALNYGLSHGIAGPLALMSLALTAAIQVPGLRDTAEHLTARLTAARTDDTWGPNWPGLTALPNGSGTPVHSSWCYGSPGVARALWLAGRALDDTSTRKLAVQALKAALIRPAPERGIDDNPGLCHGLAGLLHITLRFAHDTADPGLAAAATALAEHLLQQKEFTRQDPGFLEGAAGVVLALLAAATDQAPLWDRALLLA
ncbi:hypothetical protein AQI88_41100 [Streptomyces cellostaticus]|uniref:Lanthionine synthetase n=1 Tax=Streptomyces cellostaticus TaxID=67285 RepID=A0A101N506_9ACTN|nr:lanthionine synthetase C family protein [Streptomyces cellostaticus]KUM86681.1 hypothetical protein AQI88_41100 [Streptomyces cellostaticus]GHI10092.1 hypothetical protein Scel_84130 [Streptomyces cellostaticus]